MVRDGTKSQHLGKRLWWSKGRVIGAAAAAGVIVAGVLVAVLAVHSGPTKAQVQARIAAQNAAAAVAHEQAVQAAQTRMLAGVVVSPASDTDKVSPTTPVTVKTSTGTLVSVKVTGGSDTVTGSMNPTSTVWTSTGVLLPATTYKVTTTVADAGVEAETVSQFTTLTPTAVVTASVWPESGLSVGVGQPIVLTFDHDITGAAERQAVESHFTVAMSTPVPGGWYWFSPHELHFRPQNFWPAHEQVRVTGNLAGWDAGDGRWGSGTIDDSFSIGDARISYANLATDQMRVTLNGATVATYPISGGSNQYPTMNGDHIVLDRQSVVHMVSSTVGIPVNSPGGYDELVYNDVHISDSGEYVHAAPWSVSAQGVTNVSHGCINLSPANSLSFFNFSRVGDVVEVTGSPRAPVSGDHGVMDWLTPWNQWSPAQIVSMTPAGASSATSPAPAASAATPTSPTGASTASWSDRPSPATRIRYLPLA